MQKIIYRLLKDKNNFTIKAEGASMLPLLRSGDILFVRKIKFQNVKINDLIMAKKGKQIFTHRVIFKTQNPTSVPPPRGSPSGHPRGVLAAYLITKGDNNPQPDGKIKPGQIMGKVYQIKRHGQIIDMENFYLFQSTLYFQELQTVKKEFEKENIDYVFLKGLPLHLYFTGSHPRRIYADSDLLVQEKDHVKINRIFKNLGYREYQTQLSSFHRVVINKIDAVYFRKKINNFSILFDIHFAAHHLISQIGKLEALYPQHLIEQMTADFMAEKEIISIQSEEFPILSAQNLVLFLALHCQRHNFRGIHRLRFLDLAMRKLSKKLNINKFTEIIYTYQVQNFVYPVFWLLKKYYQTPGADALLKGLNLEFKKKKYIRENILNINIFDMETRVQAGITRFKYLYHLSGENNLKKMTVIFNLGVLYNVFWVGYSRLRKFFIWYTHHPRICRFLHLKGVSFDKLRATFQVF